MRRVKPEQIANMADSNLRARMMRDTLNLVQQRPEVGFVLMSLMAFFIDGLAQGKPNHARSCVTSWQEMRPVGSTKGGKMPRRKNPCLSHPWVLMTLMVVTSCANAGSRPASPKPAADPHAAVVSLVARIRTADYEGNRPALAKLFEGMAPYTHGPFASRAHYWRGFAMWRRALNGFNDNVDKADLAADLRSGIAEFEAALAADPQFIDAKVGAASCAVNLSFLSSGPERMAGYQRQWELLGEAQKEAPKNPRLAWVLGAARFYAPPPLGGQETAIETYEAGLESAKQERVADALDPSWGEPELLMNLAFSNLNRAQPDLDAADRYARAALAQVPNWHYVRDILIPQIQAAKAKKTAVAKQQPLLFHSEPKEARAEALIGSLGDDA